MMIARRMSYRTMPISKRLLSYKQKFHEFQEFQWFQEFRLPNRKTDSTIGLPVVDSILALG